MFKELPITRRKLYPQSKPYPRSKLYPQSKPQLAVDFCPKTFWFLPKQMNQTFLKGIKGAGQAIIAAAPTDPQHDQTCWFRARPHHKDKAEIRH